MTEYHKIQTVFKRDMSNQHKYVVVGEWTLPEFEYLRKNEWLFTEKVDGTNIRVYGTIDGRVRLAGRTDNAQMPTFLFDRLVELFPPEKFAPYTNGITLYGEGYGARIQKGGGNYKPNGVDFVLFDVQVGSWWLRRKDVEDIAATLGVQVVPIVGTGTLDDLVRMVSGGLRSTWGDFLAEGIVARPSVELCTRSGARIITKLKTRDFPVAMMRSPEQVWRV